MRWFRGLFSSVLLALTALPAASQSDFPNRHITFVVPFAAGGPTDIIGRVVAEHMSRTLGRQIIVENAVGAAGILGSIRVAKAAPDGYTLLIGPMGTMSFTPLLYPKASFNGLTDLEPIGIAASAPMILVANKKLPPGDLTAFAEYVKANGPKLATGNAGFGSASHLACLVLNNRIGAQATVVPYRGTAPALQDLVAGQIQYMCDQTTSLLEQVRADAVKPLAVLAPTRSLVMPQVPTAKEAGMDGVDMVIWNALFAPKGTPPEIIEKLNAALVKAITDPAPRERILQLGAEPPAEDQRSPQALRDIHIADVEKWGSVVRSANIKAE